MIIDAKTPDGDTLRFDSCDALRKCPAFQDIVFLEFTGFDSDSLPILPPALQILVCRKAMKLRHFPYLPRTITNVTLDNCSVEYLPDLTAFPNLELLRLLGNAIVHLANPLPPALRTFDISFNKLRTITCALPDTLAHLDVSFNFLTAKPTVPPDCQLVHDHNEYRWAPAIQPFPPYGNGGQQQTQQTQIPKQKVYSQNQNVHTSSVQDGVNDSVKVIIDITRHAKTKMPRDVAQDALDFLSPTPAVAVAPTPAVGKSKWWASIPWGFWRRTYIESHPILQKEHALASHIRSWCSNTLVHSIHGITFAFLLARVVHIARNHKDRDTLRTILEDELTQSIGMCFTGRFSRVVNVLVGFVDGVHVGVSSREQIQARMAQLSETEDPPPQKLRKAMEALTDFEHHDEWKAWVDAVVDETPARLGDIIKILDSGTLPKRPWLNALVTFETNDQLLEIVEQVVTITDAWTLAIFGERANTCLT